MFYQNMPLYVKLHNLLKLNYEIVHSLPREYKYSLGEDIVKQNWKIIDLFTKAQSVENKATKINIINNINLRFESLKLRIRFLSELKLISFSKSGQLLEFTTEIGKMVGSWRKNV